MHSVFKRLGLGVGRWKHALRTRGPRDSSRTSPERKASATDDQGWRETLDRLPDILLSLDTDWRITYLNEKSRQQLSDMLGSDHTKDELVGREFWELHPVDPSEGKLYRSCHEAMDRMEPVSHEERYDEGEGKWIRTHVYPSDDGVSIVSREITERKRKERELERQNKRLDEFSTIVSHDLRNPLNVADGYLGLAREDTDNEHLEQVARALDRMSAMIEDLLQLAREGARVKEPTWIELEDVVKACWQAIETDEATLTLEENRTIYADRNQLSQLFENLFRNAVEHAGADVEVSIGPMNGGFFIEDDGPGLSPEQQERAFEAGFSTSRDGTGFGLRIVEGIAEAHEWNVDVTTGETGGARFEFTGVIDAAIATKPDPNVFSGTSTQPERAISEPAVEAGTSASEKGYPDHRQILEIHADDADACTDYYVEIEEGSHLLPVTESAVDDRTATIDRSRFWVSDDGTRAAGRLSPGERAAYRCSTPPVDVTVDGSASTYVDGEPAQLDRYPRADASGDDWKDGFPWQDVESAHSYEFHADDTDTYTDYFFEIEDGSTISAVTESVVDDVVDPIADSSFYWISEDGTRAAGRVHAGERNAYRFSTMLCDVTVDGPATAYVDGKRSNLDRYPLDGATGDDWKGGFPWQRQHRFEIRADDADADTDYYIEIECGPMQAVPENGATIDLAHQWISRDGTRAAGRVGPGERHAFRFDGDMVDVTIDGAAVPYMNGVESELDWFPRPGATGDGWKQGFPWQK